MRMEENAVPEEDRGLTVGSFTYAKEKKQVKDTEHIVLSSEKPFIKLFHPNNIDTPSIWVKYTICSAFFNFENGKFILFEMKNKTY